MINRKNFIITSIVLLVFAYIMLAFGIFDMIAIKPYRLTAASDVKQAGSKMPPDWDYLFKSLHSPDWFVATVTLAQIAEIQKSGDILPEMVDGILELLFANISEQGHWWRFGWDKEDPEFEQFHSQLIGTISSFYLEDLLPYLENYAKHGSPTQRETVCWIVGEIAKDANDQQQKTHYDKLYAIVDGLAQSDPAPKVKSTCSTIRSRL